MGRLYEALERAEQERAKKERREIPERVVALRDTSTRRAEPPQGGAERVPLEQYEVLKTSLISRCSDRAVKAILFAGCAHGAGVSTTAINFSSLLARDNSQSVLLIEANGRSPSFHRVFNLDGGANLVGLLASEGDSPALTKIETGQFWVLPIGFRTHVNPAALFGSEPFARLMKTMRERFDYVIVDAPPVHGSAEFMPLCGQVDGIVLVISSGSTRRQVAISAKRQLEDVGANLIGVVLNKKRYHIPEYIYRRL
jgi:protein-tyrosine kinase